MDYVQQTLISINAPTQESMWNHTAHRQDALNNYAHKSKFEKASTQNSSHIHKLFL